MLGVKMIVPSRFQEPPRPLLASQIDCMPSPPASMRLSLPPAKNAMLRLSGDQKGNSGLSVPSSGCAFADARLRTQSFKLPCGVAATYATFCPSGESEIFPSSSISSPERFKFAQIKGAGLGRKKKYPKANRIAASTSALLNQRRALNFLFFAAGTAVPVSEPACLIHS